jgi:molybdopterin-synthase adenylyltransferase
LIDHFKNGLSFLEGGYMKPIFKKILKPSIVLKNESIEIKHNNKVIELHDPEKNILNLIELLDGKNDINDISIKLEVNKKDIENAIYALDEMGFLENEIVNEIALTVTEKERYRSNLNYFSNFSSINKSKYDFQLCLKNSKVVILGLGGGCLTASLLAGLGVGEIIGVDYDKVERSNLNRQYLYNEDDIGYLKTEVAERKINKINPDIKVKMYNLKIESYECLLEIIKDANLVISMIDQPSLISFRWVNAACVKLGIPFYRGGFTHNKIKWERIIPKNDEPCYDCRLIDTIQQDKESEIRLKNIYGKVFSDVNTGFGAALSILTGFFVSDVSKMLSGYSQLMKNVVVMDTTTMEIRQFDIETEKKPYCPTCGTTEFNKLTTLNELIDIANKEGVSV